MCTCTHLLRKTGGLFTDETPFISSFLLIRSQKAGSTTCLPTPILSSRKKGHFHERGGWNKSTSRGRTRRLASAIHFSWVAATVLVAAHQRPRRPLPERSRFLPAAVPPSPARLTCRRMKLVEVVLPSDRFNRLLRVAVPRLPWRRAGATAATGRSGAGGRDNKAKVDHNKEEGRQPDISASKLLWAKSRPEIKTPSHPPTHPGLTLSPATHPFLPTTPPSPPQLLSLFERSRGNRSHLAQAGRGGGCTGA